MGYFDVLTNTVVRRDSQGRVLFHPMGTLSRGRLIPDEISAERLKRRVEIGYVVLLTVVIADVVIHPSLLITAIVVGAVGILCQGYFFYLGRNLEIVTERLSLGQSYDAMAANMGRPMLWVFLILSIVMLAGSVLVVQTKPIEGSLGILLFGAGAVIFARGLRYLRRSR